MTDCIFCNIVTGEIPNHTIYEDDNFLAFLDISQIVNGHTLVIPKKHYRWVWDLPIGKQMSPNVGEYYEVVARIARHYQHVSGKAQVLSTVFGEMVPHAHIHLLPQTEGNAQLFVDGWNEALGKRKLESGELEKVRQQYSLK